MIRILIMLFVFISCNILSIAQNSNSTKIEELTFRWNKTNDSTSLWAINHKFSPIELLIKEKVNKTILETRVIPDKDSVIVFNYQILDKDSVELIRNKYTFSYYYEDPNSIKVDDNYLYRLPLKKGKKYEVGQSFNGKSTHNNVISKYAIDFTMKIGRPIHAARGGTVVIAIDWYKEAGGEKYRRKANKM